MEYTGPFQSRYTSDTRCVVGLKLFPHKIHYIFHPFVPGISMAAAISVNHFTFSTLSWHKWEDTSKRHSYNKRNCWTMEQKQRSLYAKWFVPVTSRGCSHFCPPFFLLHSIMAQMGRHVKETLSLTHSTTEPRLPRPPLSLLHVCLLARDVPVSTLLLSV